LLNNEEVLDWIRRIDRTTKMDRFGLFRVSAFSANWVIEWEKLHNTLEKKEQLQRFNVKLRTRDISKMENLLHQQESQLE